MKKNFNDLLNGTEAGMLGDTVESIKEEKVPAATVARIQSKVIGVSAAKRNTRKKMLPYIAAAACFTVFVSVVIAVGVFNRSVPDHAETSAAISDPAETSAVISDPGETNAPSVPERSGPETSAPEDVPLFTGAVIKALEPKECEDAFLPQAVGVEFTGGAGDAD
ncbi:MAG: hypothetical protein J5760_00575, partial [Clostridia bacterium]|nr:hypothetical protein [Clostridia bacterium]